MKWPQGGDPTNPRNAKSPVGAELSLEVAEQVEKATENISQCAACEKKLSRNPRKRFPLVYIGVPEMQGRLIGSRICLACFRLGQRDPEKLWATLDANLLRHHPILAPVRGHA